MSPRPEKSALIGKAPKEVPMSCQRIMASSTKLDSVWIGPNDAATLSAKDQEAYRLAHAILCHLSLRAVQEHGSGHQGGPLSAFTFCYALGKRRDPSVDQPLRISAGHLSVLAYGLQWLFGREGSDKRLADPQSIIKYFRTADGLNGHVEASIGDIPFGTGALGKGVSHALGTALGLRLLKKKGTVDVLMGDGDSQEGQIMEAFRLASHLGVDNLVVHGDFNDVQLSTLPTKTVAADFASIAHAAGWQVIEVQNGNDLAQVTAAQDKADALLGKGHPIFICYYTTMGNGIELMEQGSNSGEKNYHGGPIKNEEAEKALKLLPDFEETIAAYAPLQKQERKRYEEKPPTETNVRLEFDVRKLPYKRTITEGKGGARRDFGAVHMKNLMAADKRIFVLHGDLAASGGFDAVGKEFPDRVINVGVAEANMVMMAAGMRQAGVLPVAYTFAAFGTNEARANARMIDFNCGHTRCGIICDCTHVGLSVGEDGESAQERNYLNIPFDHTQVWCAADCNQAGAMAERSLELIAEGHQSVFTFFPRASHEQFKTPDGDIIYGDGYVFDGSADVLRGNDDASDRATIITTGFVAHNVIKAVDMLRGEDESIQVRVLNVACVRPLDASAVIKAALETCHIIVVEDHNAEGGLATQVADVIADFALPCSLRRMGVNRYFPSAAAEELILMAGLDTESIADVVQDEVRTEVRGGEDALITVLFELQHNLRTSRFREKALPFLHRLIQEKNYLELLREAWQKRACPREYLPSNEELRERLQEIL